MARGWESKSVESQIESAASRTPEQAQKELSQGEIESLRKKETLSLSRRHVLQELESSSNPRYLKMLKRALADLDKKLRALSRAT